MLLNLFSLFVIGVIIALVVFLVVKIGSASGHIASKHGHPRADAIMVLGWVGIVTLGLAWPIALVWAYTRPQQEDSLALTERVVALGVELQRIKSQGTGERRRLEITRALVTNPSVVLLDEPFSGVDPLAVFEVQKIIRSLKDRGLGRLITDHNVRETLSIVDRAYLICEWKVLREGAGEFLTNDKMSRNLYLGPQFSMQTWVDYRPRISRKRPTPSVKAGHLFDGRSLVFV